MAAAVAIIYAWFLLLRHADRLEMLRISRCRGIRRIHPVLQASSREQAPIRCLQDWMCMAHFDAQRTAEPDRGTYTYPVRIRRLSITNTVFSSMRLAGRKKGAVILYDAMRCEIVACLRHTCQAPS